MLQQKLSTQEAAQFLGLQTNTLEVWRCQKRGPQYSKVGRRVLYDINDLEAYFNANTVHTCDSIRQTNQYKGQR